MVGVTVVISTWRQPTCLSQQLALWRVCPSVAAVRVNAFDGDDTVAAAVRHATQAGGRGSAPVLIDPKPNNLTQRFAPPAGGFDTEAVFSVDVDTFYTCDALRAAFRIWAASPDRRTAVVGFSPRNLTRPKCHAVRIFGGRKRTIATTRSQQDMRCSQEMWDLSYDAPYVHNTVLVTKGAVAHRDIYTLYSAPEYAAARQRCDAALTGEDYLMSFVLAREFGAALRLISLFAPPHEMRGRSVAQVPYPRRRHTRRHTSPVNDVPCYGQV